MVDISKCSGFYGKIIKYCPKRDTCRRFLSIASEWQSYINAEYDDKTKSCSMFINNKEE